MTIDKLATAILEGDGQAAALCQACLDEGLSGQEVLDRGLLEAMSEVGRRFREDEYYVPDVLISADAMKKSMAVLRPHLSKEGVKAKATAVIGTVRGDLHDIGKNLVVTMLEGAGFEVIDLGVDVDADAFLQACVERHVDVVGLSALLTTTMPEMAVVVNKLRSELSPTPKILVGGAPLTQAFADSIGADGYGADASSSAELAKRLVHI